MLGAAVRTAGKLVRSNGARSLGSLEGYAGGRAARIALNGAGYTSPRAALARRGVKMGAVGRDLSLPVLGHPHKPLMSTGVVNHRKYDSIVSLDQRLSRVF